MAVNNVEWARRLEQVEKLKALERQACGQGGTLLPEILPEAKGDTRDIVAAEVGFGSGKTYEKAKFAADHADTETIAKLDAEETTCARFCGMGYQNGKPRFG